MTRKECLEQAMGCVLRDRNNAYGGPEDSFGVIANFWSVYLGRKVYPHDVATMMALLKIARIKANKSYADGYVDLAGYAACGAECANVELYPWQKEVMGTATPEPEFKYGDRVQFRDEIPSTSEPHWFDGIYVERLSDGGHAVKFGPHGHVIHCSDKEIRPAPKAEGCEAPVEHDAPQTTKELYSKILESNPATFKTHNPTGEELAEMAEEAEHE